MPWTESQSLSFSARHEESDTGHVADLLDDLEAFREELGELFENTPGDIEVIVHPGPLVLSLAQPWLPLARWRWRLLAAATWRAGSPCARCTCFAGSPEERASRFEGSRDA